MKLLAIFFCAALANAAVVNPIPSPFPTGNGGISGCPASPKGTKGPCWWKPNPVEVNVRRDIVEQLPDWAQKEVMCTIKCSQLHYCCWEYRKDVCTCTVPSGDLYCQFCMPPLDKNPPQPSV